MTPFITAEQLFQRFDWRWIAKNINDGTSASTSTAPPTLSQLTNTSSTPGQLLYQLMLDASEELMGAAAVGARYSEDDLRTYGGNLLISIVCGLAIGPILERRNRATSDVKELVASYDRATQRVEELRRGERIFFQVPNVPEAGLPGPTTMLPAPGMPPEIAAQAGRYFGSPGGCAGTGNPYYPPYTYNPG